MGSPPHDYDSSFIKSANVSELFSMFQNCLAYNKESHGLGVRMIETHDDGLYEPHSIERFVVYILVEHPLLV